MKKLKRALSDFFEKGIEFVKKISSSDRLAVIYDNDADGIISAALTVYSLKKLGKKIPKLVINAKGLEALKKVKRNNKLIFLDIPYVYFHKLPKDKDILIIDHHPPKELGKGVVIVNPFLESKDRYQPASYLVYKIFSRIMPLKEVEWLAAVGTVADYGFEDCKDLLKAYLRIMDKGRIGKTRLGFAARKLNSGINELGFGRMLKILASSKSLNDFLGNRKVDSAHKTFEAKLKKGERKFWRNSERFGKIIFSTLGYSGGSLASTLSSAISERYPERLILLIVKRRKSYGIHARWQRAEADVGKLMRKCCDIRGGGAQAGRWGKHEES